MPCGTVVGERNDAAVAAVIVGKLKTVGNNSYVGPGSYVPETMRKRGHPLTVQRVRGAVNVNVNVNVITRTIITEWCQAADAARYSPAEKEKTPLDCPLVRWGFRVKGVEFVKNPIHIYLGTRGGFRERGGDLVEET